MIPWANKSSRLKKSFVRFFGSIQIYTFEHELEFVIGSVKIFSTYRHGSAFDVLTNYLLRTAKAVFQILVIQIVTRELPPEIVSDDDLDSGQPQFS